METCYSVALYLFLEDDKLFSDGEQNCCKQCQNLNSKGPFDKCISGGEDVAKGACLNCFYSSSGTNCSLRKGKRNYTIPQIEIIVLTCCRSQEESRRRGEVAS